MEGSRGDDGTRVLDRGNESLEAVELLDDDGGNRPWAVSSSCFIQLPHQPSPYLVLEAHIRFGDGTAEPGTWWRVSVSDSLTAINLYAIL